MEQDPDPLKELRRQLKLDAAPKPVVARRVSPVRTSRADEDDRRRLLWRDSATILIGVVVALILGQVLIPAQTAGPTGSATALPSLIAIGSFGPPQSLAPGATFPPILNPSLGVDATPTPIPVITMGPTPSPSPSPSVAPSSSVRPSVKPSPRPSVKPTPRPTRTPTPPPTPPPTPDPPAAGFTWSPDFPNVGDSVQFTSSSSGPIDTYSWAFGDGDTSSAENPSHVYLLADTYTVTLTVSGPGGEDSASRNVVVSVLPPSP